MTLTILSTQSEAIKKYVKERMRREAEELGFDPYGDTQQQAFEREVRELEQQSLDHPEIDWEVKYWELAGHRDSHENWDTFRRKVLQGLNWDPRTGSQ